jgi:hypothetical protein
MKVNTPPSYQNIFPIFTGTTLSNYTVPSHRGLFILSSVTTNLTGVTCTNIDGTTGTIPIVANTAVVLPLVVKTISTNLGNNTTIKIHGLL